MAVFDPHHVRRVRGHFGNIGTSDATGDVGCHAGTDADVRSGGVTTMQTSQIACPSDYVQQTCRNHPDSIAVICGSDRLT
jgi:hypothetical protein